MADLFDELGIDYNAQSGQEDLFDELGIEYSTPKQSKGWGAVASDLAEEAAGIPAALAGLPRALYEELKGAGQYIAEDPLGAASEVPIGLAGALTGLYNILPRTGQYAREKEIPGFGVLGNLPMAPDAAEKLRQLTGTPERPGSGLLGSALPIGAAMKPITATGLRGAAQRGVVGGTYAAAEDESPIQGLALSMLGEGALKAPGFAAKGAKKLLPSEQLKTALSPEQIAENIRIAGDMPVNVGDILQNPDIQKLYNNRLTQMPFNSATKNMFEIRGELTKRADTLFDELKMKAGLDPDADLGAYDYGAALQDALIDRFDSARAQSRQNYDRVNAMGEAANVGIVDSNFKSALDKYLGEIKGSQKLEQLADPKLKNMLETLSSIEEVTSLKDADLTRANLGDLAYSAKFNRNKPEARVYSGLKAALDKDIQASLKEYPEIAQANKHAIEYYKENVAPFEDKDIIKYTVKGESPDRLVSSFVQYGRKSDLGDQLSKLSSKLPEQEKALLPLAVYSQAIEEGTLSPLKLKSLHKKLGGKQKEALFDSPETKRQFDDLVKAIDLNKDILQSDVNFKTGYSTLKDLGTALTLGAGAVGRVAGGDLGAALGVTAAIGGPRIAAKYLTSPKTYKKALKKAAKDQNMTESELLDALKMALEKSAVMASAQGVDNDLR